MKLKKLIAIAAAAAVGYLIVKDKVQKETVKMLVKQNAFEKCEEKNE